MSRPELFTYPTTPHVRKHYPAGYAEYQRFKPWLRDEFEFRCVYCLQRETWSRDRHAVFSVEHVVPRSVDPSLACEYTNLLYACTRCNSARQDVPVLDPTQNPLGQHIAVGDDGAVRPLTDEGAFLVELLHLDADAMVAERVRIFRLRDRHSAYPDDQGVADDFRRAFGYPDDLPNLRRLDPPLGNAKSNGCENSFYARMERNELPQIY